MKQHSFLKKPSKEFIPQEYIIHLFNSIGLSRLTLDDRCYSFLVKVSTEIVNIINLPREANNCITFHFDDLGKHIPQKIGKANTFVVDYWYEQFLVDSLISKSTNIGMKFYSFKVNRKTRFCLKPFHKSIRLHYAYDVEKEA